MKLRVWSDVHLEFGMFNYTKLPEDKDTILLLAGDIHTGINAVQFVSDCCVQFKEVVYIHGNHEYYHNDILSICDFWKEIELHTQNFHFLNNEAIVIDDLRIIGGTMWTNIDKGNPLACQALPGMMNDFNYIRHNSKTFSVTKWLELNNEFEVFLTNELLKGFAGKTLVMTHHAPCYLSIAKKYAGDIMNHGFYSDMSEHMLNDNAPNFWIHGHVHNSFDYVIGDTRVVCNPRGYHPRELNPQFNPLLTIEV